MGADRLKEIKDAAKRGWNTAGQRLLDPAQLSLFDVDPTFARRSFRLLLKGAATACVGDELLLHTANDELFVTRGSEVVCERADVPASIVEDLKVGSSLCIEVVGVGVLANTIEVAPK